MMPAALYFYRRQTGKLRIDTSGVVVKLLSGVSRVEPQRLIDCDPKLWRVYG